MITRVGADRRHALSLGAAVAMVSVLELMVMGRAVMMLVFALVVSYAVWLSRGPIAASSKALVVFGVAVAVQAGHLTEEVATGFPRAFPPVLGAEPWSNERFLIFNLAWLAAFVGAAAGLRRGNPFAVVVALFLAIGGGIGNGLGHVALAARAEGYFPGLYTAPLCLVVGTVLLVQLTHRSR